MALKKNVFTPELVELLDGLTDLAFAAYLHELVVKRAILADRKKPKLPDLKLEAKFGAFFVGTTLPVPDYFGSRNWEKCLVTRPYDRQHATEEDPHELALEIGGRFQAQIICTVFEEMEVFLRDI